ncbi:MAG TPA: cytochrome c [Terriglobia bacterium]|jgi:mono/diheme cytochrome c family protein|nr:cytochrome c [Terriglobia bacterium]
MKSKLTVLALVLSFISELTAKDVSQANSSGAAHYERLCAGCHGGDGLASDGEAPPLAGSSWVSGPETRLIRMVMHGVRGPIQVGDRMYDREMPGVGSKLADREMAAMLSFVRRRWGGSSAPITSEAVKRVRRAAGTRTRYWTVEELLAKP